MEKSPGHGRGFFVAEDLVGQDRAELHQALFCPPRHVGRQKHPAVRQEALKRFPRFRVRHLRQGLQRPSFKLQHVQTCPPHRSCIQGVQKVCGAHNGAACGVQEHDGLGPLAQPRGVHQALGFLGPRQVQTHDIRLGVQLFEWCGCDVGQGPVHSRGVAPAFLVFVVRQDPASEPAQALGEGVAHVAVPDDAHGHGLQFAASMGFPQPLALPNRGVARLDVVEEVQQEAGGVLGHGVAVALRAAVHGNAQLGGDFEVDVFEPGSAACNPMQVRQGAQKVGRQPDAAAKHEGVHGRGLGRCKQVLPRQGCRVVARHAGRFKARLKDGVHRVEKPNVEVRPACHARQAMRLATNEPMLK